MCCPACVPFHSIPKAWQRLESDLLSSEVPIPVYFGYEDDGELSLVYEQLSKAGEKDRNSSALSGGCGKSCD